MTGRRIFSVAVVGTLVGACGSDGHLVTVDGGGDAAVDAAPADGGILLADAGVPDVGPSNEARDASPEAIVPFDDLQVDPKDNRAFVYMPGMRRLGSAGLVRVALLGASPPPSVKADSTWTLLVTSPDGQPLAEAHVNVESSMPDHGHGTRAPTITRGDRPGVFLVAPMHYYMLGFWFTSVDVTLGDAGTDTVTFGFLTTDDSKP